MSMRLPSRVIGLLSASLAIVPAGLALAATESGTNPGTNGRIAFVSDKDGNDEIYAIEPNGTAQYDMSNNAANDIDPAWSPDGSKLAFASDRDGNLDIYVMRADGTGQVRITSGTRSDRYPTWSPDGTQLAYRSNSGGDFDIHVMNIDGSGDRLLAPSPAFDSEPAWSPDGSRIAYTSDRSGYKEIWVVAAGGGDPVQLTNTPGALPTLELFSNRFASWSPDSSRIAFTSNRDGNEELYVVNADGTNPVRYTISKNSDRYPVWSPDGTQIAFRSSQAGERAIFLMSAAGPSIKTQLTANSARDIMPSWQPLPTGVQPVLPPLPPAGPGTGPGGTGGPGTGPGTTPAVVVRLVVSRYAALPARFQTMLPANCRVSLAVSRTLSSGCVAAGKRLGTILRFTLSGKGKVKFTVRKVGKSKVLGTWVANGKTGVNRMRFKGTFARKPLPNGAYNISVVAGTGGRASVPVKLRAVVKNR
jgi:dipeptidyl aminopeptidase/acylaminoacyl peptidase